MEQYDKRVVVEWSESGWSNQEITIRWIETQFKLAVPEPYSSSPEPRLITLDVYAPQRTAKALDSFHKLNTVTAYIPNGCTGFVQPLDVAVNKPLKDVISDMIDEEVEKDLDRWYNLSKRKGMAVGDRRILMTKCVGEAWERFCQEKSEMIIKSFQRAGIALPPDGSQDDKITVEDLSGIGMQIGGEQEWKNGGLNCNLMKGRKTGSGIVQEDDWPCTIQELQSRGWLPKKTKSEGGENGIEDGDNAEEDGTYIVEKEI